MYGYSRRSTFLKHTFTFARRDAIGAFVQKELFLNLYTCQIHISYEKVPNITWYYAALIYVGSFRYQLNI